MTESSVTLAGGVTAFLAFADTTVLYSHLRMCHSQAAPRFQMPLSRHGPSSLGASFRQLPGFFFAQSLSGNIKQDYKAFEA